MSKLSKNFDSREFSCRCCGQHKTSIELIESLQELRDLCDAQIHINSGYRCISHNRAIGGVWNSQHVHGNAADIRISGLSTKEMALLAEQIDAFKNGGIGIYSQSLFIHVDVRGTKARWAVIDGNYINYEEGLK